MLTMVTWLLRYNTRVHIIGWPHSPPTGEWHNTPNVQVLTVHDFEALAPQAGITILDRVVLHEGQTIHWDHNWRGSIAVYRVKKRSA